MQAVNPILPGFHPDPSICRAGDAYYLVNSTLGIYPGLPIYRSYDLCSWELVCNALEGAENLPLGDCCTHSSGIYAPTLRYHNGRFYLIVINMHEGGLMLLHADDAAGPWSAPMFPKEPLWAFDPSLFFDDDGRCYLTGSRGNSAGERFYGDLEVFAQQLDPDTFELLSEPHTLWRGALYDVAWVEGSHLYRHDGWYYLIVAEAGTGREHAVTVARSSELFGTYTGCPVNPIFTHRHLGLHYPVVNVGHGDLIEAPDGSWYMVVLGSRQLDGYVTMGRETFLARVIWENGWPAVNPGIGKLEQTVAVPDVVRAKPAAAQTVYTFRESCLPPEFVTLRNPPVHSYETGNGLLLRLIPQTLSDAGGCAFWGLRQASHHCTLCADISFTPTQDAQEAGLAIVHSEEAQLRLVFRQIHGEQLLSVLQYAKGELTELARVGCPQMPQTLELRINGLRADALAVSEAQRTQLAAGIDLHFLSTELAGGFVGCLLGVYASSNGGADTNTARVTRLECRNDPE